MEERYVIESIEQLRAIAEMLRLRIINHLTPQPMTVTQLGESLGEAPSKIHYHVRELEKVGLLRLVETREKGGILEKYYQPVARYIAVEPHLLSAPADETTATMTNWLEQTKNGFLSIYRSALDEPEEGVRNDLFKRLCLAFGTLYLTAEEGRNLAKQIEELSRPYEARRGIEGELETSINILMYPHVRSLQEPAEPISTPQSSWALGITTYGRAELEHALVEKRRLRIHVLGTCRFAKDVSPELADAAIEEIRVLGKIEASPAVLKILEQKLSASEMPS